MKLLSGRALVCSKGHAGHSPPPYEDFPGPQFALSCKFDVKLAAYLRWQRGGAGEGRRQRFNDYEQDEQRRGYSFQSC